MVSVVLTSNKYRHLLENFSTLYHRFFGTDVETIVSCFKRPLKHNFIYYRLITLGDDDLPWSQQLKKTLRRVDDDLVLLWHEDFYLKAPVEREKLKLLHAIMLADKTIKRIGLQSVKDGYENCSVLYKPETYSGLYQLRENAEYLCSMELSLWRKDFLLEMIVENEDHHQIEIEMSKRAKGSTVLVCQNPIATYSDAMRNGEQRIKFVDGKMLVLVPGDTWEDTGVTL